MCRRPVPEHAIRHTEDDPLVPLHQNPEGVGITIHDLLDQDLFVCVLMQ